MTGISRLVRLKDDLLALLELVLDGDVAEAEVRVGGRLDDGLRRADFLVPVLEPCHEALLVLGRRVGELVDGLDLQEARRANLLRQGIVFEHLRTQRDKGEELHENQFLRSRARVFRFSSVYVSLFLYIARCVVIANVVFLLALQSSEQKSLRKHEDDDERERATKDLQIVMQKQPATMLQHNRELLSRNMAQGA